MSQVWDLTFIVVNPHAVLVGPTFQPVTISLFGVPFFQHLSASNLVSSSNVLRMHSDLSILSFYKAIEYFQN